MSTHPDSTNFVRQTSPKRRPLKRTLSSANRPTSSTTTNQPDKIYRYQQVDENGSAENVCEADRHESRAKEANVVEETQESDDKENHPVAKRSRIIPNIMTANNLSPPTTMFNDDDDEVQVIKTDNAQPRPSPPSSQATFHSTSAHRTKPSTVPSASSSSSVRYALSTSNVSPSIRLSPAISNASSHVRYPPSCDSSVVRPSSSNAVRAPVPPNNLLNAPSPRGIPVDTCCEVYFTNCTTQKPRLHILSIDKMSECIYTAESQHFNNYFRFYCIYHSSPRCYVEIVPSENNGVLYQFGFHLPSCYREPRSRCPDTVIFSEGEMMMYVKAQKCELYLRSLILTVPSGSVSYEFKMTKSRNPAFEAMCGCPAKAAMTANGVWVNYTHNPDCKVLINAQADADGRHVAHAIQDEEGSGPSSTLMIPQRSSSNARIQRVGINLPPNPRMANWLSTHALQHLKIRINEQRAYMYWNRVQWSDKVRVKDAKVWKFRPNCVEDVFFFLLIGNFTDFNYLMQYYRKAFLKNFHMLGKYKGTDYGTIRADSVPVRNIFEDSTLSPELLQFIAVFSQFRFVMFTSDTKYDAFGNMNDTTLPIAVVKRRGTDKFQVFIGNFTCS